LITLLDHLAAFFSKTPNHSSCSSVPDHQERTINKNKEKKGFGKMTTSINHFFFRRSPASSASLSTEQARSLFASYKHHLRLALRNYPSLEQLPDALAYLGSNPMLRLVNESKDPALPSARRMYQPYLRPPM
jgi:hypothetical protein